MENIADLAIKKGITIVFKLQRLGLIVDQTLISRKVWS